ncbi:MAG: hypothetical protein OXC18_06860 [Desulfurellaceae bacterium]|nr:hypothetical protein [Desulfurellaceae bacterium]
MSREVIIQIYFEKDGQYKSERKTFGLEDFGMIPAVGDIIFSPYTGSLALG